MVDCDPNLQVFIVVLKLFKAFPLIVDLQLQHLNILALFNIFVDCWQLFESDAVDLSSQNFIDFVVEVLELFAQLPIGCFVILHQPFLVTF